MLTFPCCKINLGLDILSRRTDSYHDIETVMYPVAGLYDSLEIIRSADRELCFTVSGIDTQCPPEQNLVLRACRLMQERYDTPGMRIHLHKAIPFGAGLGGGSADAAFAINTIDAVFGLHLDLSTRRMLAAELGSDVPFFITGTPALCSGRGEILTPCPIDLRGKTLLIVHPDLHISTAEAYAGISPVIPERRLEVRIAEPIDQWRHTVTNRFEESLFARHPELHAIKKALYECGALYASLSGSGSALFGIFEDRPVYRPVTPHEQTFILPVR